MPFINFTNVATMLLTLVVFLLALVLSKETKKSGIIATMLSVFLIILVCHAVLLFHTYGWMKFKQKLKIEKA